MKKGISPLISGTIFVLITITIATLIIGFMTQISQERSESLRSTTAERLRCEIADMFIDTMDYDCNINCPTGVPYSLNATIKNSGGIRLSFEKAQVILSNGEVYTLHGEEQVVNVGESEEVGFNSIMIYSTPTLPLGGSYDEYESDDYTHGLWHFNNLTTYSIYDSSSYNNEGQTTAVITSNGKFGNGRMFNGIDSFVDIDHSSSLDITEQISIEFWAKPASLQPEETGIFCKGVQGEEQYCVDIVQGDKVRFFVLIGGQEYSVTSQNTLGTGQWNRIECAYNGLQLKIYLNGVLTGVSTTGNLDSNSHNLTIGARSDQGQYILAFNGTLDEIRLSNISRQYEENPSEVTLTYSVQYPDIDTVSLYAGGSLISQVEMSGGNTYEDSLQVSPYDEYRVVVESGDKTIDKWYPFSPGGSCLGKTTIDRIIVSSNECPNSAYDAFPGNDIYFVSCVG